MELFFFFGLILVPPLSHSKPSKKKPHQDPVKVGPARVDGDAAPVRSSSSSNSSVVAACFSPSSSSTFLATTINPREMQVQVEHAERVRRGDPEKHVREPLHPFAVRQDPVEVDARLADALADERLVDSAAARAARVRELVGERAQDAGHGRDADAGAEEDDDIVVSEFLVKEVGGWWLVVVGSEGGEGSRMEGKEKKAVR